MLPIAASVRRVCLWAPYLAFLSATPAGAADVKPHIVGRIQYQGELAEPADAQGVVVFTKFPPGVTVLGNARVVIADLRQPNRESAESMFKTVASRIGGDAIELRKEQDVTSNFRVPEGDAKRGAATLPEYIMAAVVARANSGGGMLRIGRWRFAVGEADRFGDVDVVGRTSFTLCRTHDEREWSVGRVGPRYHAERRGPTVVVVTGPSERTYDVRITRTRAKVYLHNSPKLVTEEDGSGTATLPPRPEDMLFYTEFLLGIGTFERRD